ncbi:hypothetical protein [Nonomuraea sediminis]|uniref:hypothetical protein n=1 Tax=Nonomuraea sediminis TaxID=2835864 RepID=UPI001BDDAFFE|nr:hypothetical protein [Nonomuraea sediminis]
MELAPIRVNAVHPGVIGESPSWRDKDLTTVIARTLTRRLATMRDIVAAVAFLLRNRSVHGIDCGWQLV